MAFRSPFFHQRRWDDGSTLTRRRSANRSPRSSARRIRIFHRGELHSLLAKAGAARARASGARCIGVEQDARRGAAPFENGVKVEADMLIAADGIHSAVRRILLGPEKPASLAGPIAASLPPSGCATFRGVDRILGPGRHFIHYFVSGGRMLNFVGHVEQDDWISESWTEPGKVSGSARRLCGLAPAGSAHHRRGRRDLYRAVLDRPPIDRWTYGRVTMLGDACHPMIRSWARAAPRRSRMPPPSPPACKNAATT